MTFPPECAGPAKAWAVAALCALWGVAWPMVLLESTKGLRGLLGLSRDRGAYDLVAILYRGSDVVLYLWLFLLALVVFRLMLGLARWLDRERRVPMALRWALRVHSVRWSFAAIAVWAILVWVSPGAWEDALTVVAIGLYFVPLILSAFIASRPQTLLQAEDVGGWRPYWPGWRAMFVILGLFLISLALEASADLARSFAVSGAKLAIWASTMPLEIALDLVSAAAWFGYCSFGAFASTGRALGRWRFLRVYLGGYVYMAIAGCLVAVPIMVVAMVMVYIGPQYEDMARTLGQPLPGGMQVFLHAVVDSAVWSGCA